jgi:hypothetical protein
LPISFGRGARRRTMTKSTRRRMRAAATSIGLLACWSAGALCAVGACVACYSHASFGRGARRRMTTKSTRRRMRAAATSIDLFVC